MSSRKAAKRPPMPHFEPTGDALGQQSAAGVELRVPATLDQHGSGMVNPIAATAVTNADRFDIDAMMRCVAHDVVLSGLRTH